MKNLCLNISEKLRRKRRSSILVEFLQYAYKVRNRQQLFGKDQHSPTLPANDKMDPGRHPSAGGRWQWRRHQRQSTTATYRSMVNILCFLTSFQSSSFKCGGCSFCCVFGILLAFLFLLDDQSIDRSIEKLDLATGNKEQSWNHGLTTSNFATVKRPWEKKTNCKEFQQLSLRYLRYVC